MPYIDEVRRKAIHLASALIPIIYAFIPAQLALAILIPLLAVSLLMDLLRMHVPAAGRWIDRWFGKLFRREEARRLSGATYVLLAGVLCIWLFPKPVAIAVLLIMSIADAAASLIGRKFGRTRFVGKSVEGSAAHLVASCTIALAALPGAPLAALCGALCATVMEALPLRIGRHHVDDNLTVPLAAGAVITLLGAG